MPIVSMDLLKNDAGTHSSGWKPSPMPKVSPSFASGGVSLPINHSTQGIGNNLPTAPNIAPITKDEIIPELSQIKTSYDGLNKNILAVINSPEIGSVRAMVLDGTLSQESTWSTPFENSNPENRLPSLMGALQSGVASDTAKDLTKKIDAGENLSEMIAKAGGRSSFTKVNSTQIFVSSQSAQIQLTLLLSAWTDANLEVEQQIGKLHQMSAPKHLSNESLAQSVIQNMEFTLETFMPSLIPPKVTLVYGGRTYTDLILQNFQRPLSGLMDSNGNLLQAEVNITLVGYQAWDAGDVKKLY